MEVRADWRKRTMLLLTSRKASEAREVGRRDGVGCWRSRRPAPTAAFPSGPGDGGQGLFLQRDPRLSAGSGYRSASSRKRRRGGRPQSQGSAEVVRSAAARRRTNAAMSLRRVKQHPEAAAVPGRPVHKLALTFRGGRPAGRRHLGPGSHSTRRHAPSAQFHAVTTRTPPSPGCLSDALADARPDRELVRGDTDSVNLWCCAG